MFVWIHGVFVATPLEWCHNLMFALLSEAEKPTLAVGGSMLHVFICMEQDSSIVNGFILTLPICFS